MRDSFGRSIDYLRISVTDRCNLRCVYCMPEEGVKLLPHEDIVSYEEITQIAKAAIKLGFKKIRLTGGEPLVRKNITELVSMLAGLKGIETLAMTTNGTLLEQYAKDLKRAGLTKINISLDTMDPEFYSRLTRGGSLDAAIAGIEAAKRAGLAVKINTVVLSEDNYSLDTTTIETSSSISAATNRHVEAVAAYALSIGADFQRIAQYRLSEIKKDYINYDRPPACASCNRLRLLADGSLRPCLHSTLSIPVDFNDIEASIRAAIGIKPARGQECSDLEVGQIGG